MSWGESVGIYAGFGFLGAILFGVYACITITCRRCCCCCCGRYGTCGQTQPTRAAERGCYRLGFHVFPIGTTNDELGAEASAVAPVDKQGDILDPIAQERLAMARVRYPMRSRWLSRVCLIVYGVLVIAFVIVGHERGNLGLTDAQKSVAAAPTGIMQSIQALAGPMQTLVVGLASSVVATTMVRVNGTLTSALDVTALEVDLQCVSDGLAEENLPDPGATDDFVDGEFFGVVS